MVNLTLCTILVNCGKLSHHCVVVMTYGGKLDLCVRAVLAGVGTATDRAWEVAPLHA